MINMRSKRPPKPPFFLFTSKWSEFSLNFLYQFIPLQLWSKSSKKDRIGHYYKGGYWKGFFIDVEQGGAELEASQPQKEGTNPKKRNEMSSELLPQESRHPHPLEIGAQQKKRFKKKLSIFHVFFLFASRKLPFHRDRCGMNFVNRFLASYWSWLVPASFFLLRVLELPFTK